MKKQNGITLLALVITIIVLLILAGVAINTLMGDGSIIENANEAVGKYNNSVIKEQEMLNEIREYIKNDGNVEESDGITISVVADTTGIAKKVTLTIAAISEEGIKSLTSNAGINETYTEGTKEILETYEVTANGSYTFTVENSSGKTASKTVEISNILEGTIQISASPSTPTKNNVTVTVVWPSNANNGIKEISTNGGATWQTVTGETSEVEVTSNCTVKARVKNSTQEISTATLTINNIDKVNPTVTATAGTETITEGDSNELSKYFTYTANGTTGIASVVYTDTSNGNEVVTNTNTLAVGTHIIKCTVTKETGATASATKTIVVESAEIIPVAEYGVYVTNYTAPKGDPNIKWRIFYADESNIYLIADDYIHYDYAPRSANYTLNSHGYGYTLSFDNVYKDYTGSKSITDTRIKKWIQKYLDVAPSSTNTNIRAVAFMLDNNVWDSYYRNTSYAEYAIGGPTLELFVASYNKTHPEKKMYCKADAIGYYISWTEGGNDEFISELNTSESLYVIKDDENADAMWLGSPSTRTTVGLMFVGSDGWVENGDYADWNPGFRPIVCLNSEVKLEKQSDGNYIIK